MWLEKEGYQECHSDIKGFRKFSKKARYKHWTCLDNGQLDIVLSVNDIEPEASMVVSGRGKQFRTAVEAFEIPAEDLPRIGRQIESRLISAWIEMVA